MGEKTKYSPKKGKKNKEIVRRKKTQENLGAILDKTLEYDDDLSVSFNG